MYKRVVVRRTVDYRSSTVDSSMFDIDDNHLRWQDKDCYTQQNFHPVATRNDHNEDIGNQLNLQDKQSENRIFERMDSMNSNKFENVVDGD